ncbi:UNVERIFIED_CONTAM: hypothetical protein H355_001592 [Colinus virginianus]|nr:hypothetical protein H355_001592 [Colinus virginianus]
MDPKGLQGEDKLKMLIILLAYLLSRVICETGDCREQEFRDHTGNCILCKQCGPGMELSKECGFGYGEDAQCMTCRPNRFKEDWGFQKCKPCLDCALVNRFQKANCSATSNALCGDCLPGFYRKTKLGGFQDMECVPCGDPPPPYEPHCTTKVNLVKIPSTASSPRDTALAAVICSALATVLLALLILCVIYCKRQFMEKKPSWSLRSQDVHYNGSELSCFDRPRLNEYDRRTCCQCQRSTSQTCELAGVAANSCSLETENATTIESDNNQELSDVLTSAKSPDGNIAKSFEISKHRTYIEVSSLQNSAAAETQPNTKCNGTADDSTD